MRKANVDYAGMGRAGQTSPALVPCTDVERHNQQFGNSMGEVSNLPKASLILLRIILRHVG